MKISWVSTEMNELELIQPGKNKKRLLEMAHTWNIKPNGFNQLLFCDKKRQW